MSIIKHIQAFYRHGEFYYEFFNFKEVTYGVHYQYYDGHNLGINTGVVNMSFHW